MRLFSGSIAASLLVMLGISCNTVDPSECWPNTSGGFGGAGTIPIGAGVGATTGDYDSPPNGGTPNPCVTPSPQMPATDYINCRARGLDAAACSEACFSAGASCVPLAMHPYKSGLEPGKLTSCKNGSPSIVCGYTFANGDGCSLAYAFGVSLKWFCVYAGG
jgi:hypothetical protein